ncbi:hypothetical protein P885DRAFT_64659 [Corynascus similis CBS 632.67]
MASDSIHEADPEKAVQGQNDLKDTDPNTTDPATPPKAYNPSEERLLLRHQDLTIFPLSAFIHVLCYLDRSNIGNSRIPNSSAHHGMQTAIRATQHHFNIVLMIFLIGYALFEVPFNILLKNCALLGGSPFSCSRGGGRALWRSNERSVRVAFILSTASLAGSFGGGDCYANSSSHTRADRFNAGGLHSAGFALIGAVGFMAAALLPPDAYLHR